MCVWVRGLNIWYICLWEGHAPNIAGSAGSLLCKYPMSSSTHVLCVVESEICRPLSRFAPFKDFAAKLLRISPLSAARGRARFRSCHHALAKHTTELGSARGPGACMPCLFWKRKMFWVHLDANEPTFRLRKTYNSSVCHFVSLSLAKTETQCKIEKGSSLSVTDFTI